MLDAKRKSEAQNNLRNYLMEDMIKKVSYPESAIQNIFIQNCKESLKSAQLLFDGNHSNLWTIVCSYYSMYYIANAVLYSLNLKVGHKISHKVTADALIVYVKDKLTDSLIEDYEEIKDEALEIAGLEADDIIESFDRERIKRSRIQYSITEQVKRAKAKTSLERAKSFVFEMKKLLSV